MGRGEVGRRRWEEEGGGESPLLVSSPRRRRSIKPMPINAVERFVDSRLHGNDTGVDLLDCFTAFAMTFHLLVIPDLIRDLF